MSATTLRVPDAGPLARLDEVKADPTTMGVIVQRITDADEPQTLKDIARAWRVPLGRLAEWITEDRERSEQYANALRIASEQYALESLKIADSAAPEAGAVQKAKLQVDTRFRLASKLSREKFGEAVEHKHSGSISLISVLAAMPRGRVVDVTPATATGALPAPDAELTVEKNPEKTSPASELI